MLRQISSRNHRSKGFKLKNALQICLLVVVTIWLLFQVKHSYDKKSEYEDRNAHLSIKHERNGDRHEAFEIGRKGLPHDVRIEDEVSEDDLEQELLKHDENGESDAIDEQDQGKDDDGGDEQSVFEDAESNKEGANAAREESFRGDDVASAVVVSHTGRPEERGDHSREAREKSFNGDNVSSAVAHEDHLESAESKVGGGENLTFVDSTSDGGSKDREVTPNNEVSSNSTVDEPNNDTKPRVDPTTTNVNGNRTETPFSSSNKTAGQEAIESPTNATTVSSNQIELSTNLNETTNSGSGSARDGNGTVIQIPGDDKLNTGATTSSASSEKGEGKVEFQDATRNMAEEEMREVPIAKIEKLAKSGEEAVLE
ncbi:midasin-like [Ananas comosus]|uniref:Midasin-like n=1 Tax=Ananas comosus TaxID=4615 RepID=A0A6P5GDS4_ANACO|nr:midasin-like [Ananas comosus]